MIRVGILLLLAVMATARPAAAQDWRLIDADAITPGSFIILTVPADSPETLSAVAAALAADFDIPLSAEWPLNAIAVHCLVFDATGAADIDALLTALQADARVRTAQRIQGFNMSETVEAAHGALLPLQWALGRMNVMAAHKVTTGEGVRIGIVDSAIDRSHPDLSRRVADTRDFVAALSFGGPEEHGTAVAGVIGADAMEDGIVGVAPGADLVGLRACWQVTGASGLCNSFSLARAVNFAILNDIDVLNMSLGGPEDPLLTELIAAAMDSGMVVVAAAGETEETMFPASLPGVIAAGAAGSDRVPAPMVDVLSTAPGDAHRYVSGSSIATAHVSGVVALMLAASPDLASSDVATHLMGAIHDSQPGPMLDACRAVAGANAECAQ